MNRKRELLTVTEREARWRERIIERLRGEAADLRGCLAAVEERIAMQQAIVAALRNGGGDG